MQHHIMVRVKNKSDLCNNPDPVDSYGTRLMLTLDIISLAGEFIRVVPLSGRREIYLSTNGQAFHESWLIFGYDKNHRAGKVECTCGACHTSNPEYHLSYCDLSN